MIQQLVNRGLFAGLVLALTASCGDGNETPSAGGSSGTPAAGNVGPTAPSAGTPGTAVSSASGSPAVARAGSGGATGTSMSGVSTAGTTAAASGSGATPAGVGAAGAAAAAGGTGPTGTAAAGGNAVAGTGGGGAAGMSGAAAGCGSESFAAIYESILKNATYNCAGPLCHGRETSMAMTVGNLSFSSVDVAYMELVKVDSTGMACSGMPRVVPGDPASSLLVQKLRSGTTTCGGVMPVGADEITDTDLKRISDWISAGACDN